MTAGELEVRMSAVELSERVALDRIRVDERNRQADRVRRPRRRR
jgi:hypothetical protein